MKNKNLAIIVLNYNDGDTTINYINSIKKYKTIDKFIVVDNNSTDDSFEKMQELKSDNIDVIKSDSNKGYAYGNNYGYNYLNEKYGEFNYICISNPDVIVEESAFKKCVDFLDKNKEYAACAPRMYDRNDEPHRLSGWKERTLKNDVRDSSKFLTHLTQKSHEEMYDKDYFDHKPYRDVDALAGSFFIIRSDIFKKVGLFDENTFLYYEEDILFKKIRDNGKKLAVITGTKFNHMEAVTVSKNINSGRKFKIMQKSKKYYHKTYNSDVNHGLKKLKLISLDLVTIFKFLDRPMTKILDRIMYIKHLGIINCILKILFLILTYIFLPITTLFKKIRKREKILYFSLVDWRWIKQRPHFVALYLADNGYNVTYTFQKVIKSEDGATVRNKTDKKNLKIKPYYILPAENSKIRLIINCWISIIKCFFWNYDKVILTQPNQCDFIFFKILKVRGTDVYYECMDNYVEWEPDKTIFKSKEAKLIPKVSHTFVSSQKLYNDFVRNYNLNSDQITLVRNGYDKELFEKYEYKDAKFTSPNMVYIGTVDTWFDFQTILNFAKKHSDYTIYIIGPVNKNIKVPNQKNIVFLGSIEHKYVPSYIEQSDILLLPFVINDVIEYVDPVKMYEYLYLKKPVISSYWGELDQFNGLVYFYKDEKEFEKAALNATKNEYKINDDYKKLMHDSSWNNRLKGYLKGLQKKNEKLGVKNTLISLLLIIVIISQFYFISKNTFCEYIFKPQYNVDRYDINTLVLSKELELTKNIIPRKKGINVAITIDNSDEKYNVPLQFYYDKLLFYPNRIVDNYKNNDASYYKNPKIAKKYLDDSKIDYLIIVGDNIDYLSYITTKDITIFSYKDKVLKKEAEFDSNLYSFEKEAKKYNKKELFNETIDSINKYVETYSNTYSPAGVEELTEYANDLYNNNEYKRAEKYYKLLTDKKVKEPIVYYNYSKILIMNKNYTEASNNINRCLKYKKCPKNASHIKKNIEEELR